MLEAGAYFENFFLPSMKKYLGIGGAVLGVLVIGGLIWWYGPHISFTGAAASQPTNRYQRIAETTPLVVKFAVPMDEASVLEHTTVDPVTEGTWEWKDKQTLAFHASAPLTMSGTYTVRVAPEAMRRDKAVLGSETVVRYFVAGPPQVSQVLPPRDFDAISADRPITIVFDRPMTALTTISERGNQFTDWPVTIEPKVEGTWKWISTTTAEFTPKNGLARATKYHVSVPVGITSVNEEKTAKDYSWDFTTALARVLTTEPESGYTSASPKIEYVLHFNQEVDLSSVEQQAKFYLLTQNAQPSTELLQSMQTASVPQEVAQAIGVKASYGTVEEDGVKYTDKTTVVLQPVQQLGWDSWHVVLVQPGVKALGGNLGSDKTLAATFKTVGPMKAVGVNQEYESLTVQFSNAYDSASLKKGLTITPKPKGWDDITFDENYSQGNILYVYPQLEPSTEYTVTVNKNVKDIFGQTLQEEKTFTFKTKPISPRVFIHSNGTFGVFERGFDPVYYLNGVNVSQMNVQFAKLSMEQFVAIQKESQNNWEYVPTLSDKEMYQTWTIPQKAKENEWNVEEFNLHEKLKRELAPGIYALTLSAPEYKNNWNNTNTPIVEKIYFTVTDTALTFKYSGNKALVWAVNMKTGAPVVGASIGLHDTTGKRVTGGKTGAEGFFETTIDSKSFTPEGYYYPEIWVTADSQGDSAFVGSSWNNGMQSWDFGYNENFQLGANGSELLSYIYTDRPIYRPGDTVQFKGIVRLKDVNGVLHTPNSGRRVMVTITNDQGTVVMSEEKAFNDLGSFIGELPLDENVTLGQYYITIEFVGATDIQNNWGNASFQVLAYRKPEYRVDVTMENDEYYSGDTVKATVEGAYYFGMPMSSAKVAWRAMSTDYFFNQYTDGWYSFSLEDSWCWYNCERGTTPLAEGKGSLDAKGMYTLELPVNLQDQALSQVISFDVDVTDQNNQVVSTRASVPVHKSKVYVGIRPEDYAVEPGEKASISLVTVKPDGSPIGGQNVAITVFKREWNVTRTKGVDGQYYYDNQPKDEKVSGFSSTTNADGKLTTQVTIPQGGQFRILAEVVDGSGNKSAADTSVYAWSNTYVNWPRTNNNRMEVRADKPEYAVGDTATLIVQSPFQGENVKALVTVEREGVINRSVVTITSAAQPIKIPITADLIPNAYVSVVVIKPREGETFNENGLDTGSPAFRIGYTRLLVETKQKELSVSLTTDKKNYLPGETVHVTLEAKDFAQKPQSAELSLGVVDMSVLDLTGYSLPNLLGAFFSERGLGVRTAQNLLYLLERFKPGSKGGGGGGDPADRARNNFKDTAYWNPRIQTDASGKATISFTLPDNLTTWKLVAIGHTADSVVGSVDTEIIESKKVIVRPVRPRFAVHGDQAELAAIVLNGTDSEQTFVVSLSGDGFAGTGESQTITLAPGTQKKVLFPVTFGTTDKASFVFKAEGKGFRDEIHESIPLVPFGVPQSTATSGFIEDQGATEQVYIPVQEEVSNLSVQAVLSPTLAVYLPKSLSYLVQFPYGCAEQTVSSFLPNIAVAQLEGLDAFDVVTDDVLKKNVTGGVERLLSFQRADGGFGYWSESTESYPYLTAYVLHALTLARNAGYTVDSTIIDNARNYVVASLRKQYLEKSVDLSERMYILYVLGETGTVDEALLNNIFEKREKLPLFANAYLAMSYKRAGNTVRAQKILNEILAQANTDSRHVSFDEKDGWSLRRLMNTNQRSNAIILQAMIQIDPENPLTSQLVRSLLQMRREGHWDTTQSTTASIFALVEYLKSTGELTGDFDAALSVDGKEVATAAFDASNILTKQEVEIPSAAFEPGQFNAVDVSKSGNGRLYYDLLMNYFWKTDTVEPAEEGLSIVREITPVAGSAVSPTVGGTYKIKLSITVPEERHFVAIESPHPAGFEGIDFALQTTQQYLQEEIQPNDDPYRWWQDSSWYFSHKEFRDDQVFLFADNLPAGVYHYEYLVRATLPGTFKWRPARAYEMYFPEVFGNTESSVVDIH